RQTRFLLNAVRADDLPGAALLPQDKMHVVAARAARDRHRDMRRIALSAEDNGMSSAVLGVGSFGQAYKRLLIHRLAVDGGVTIQVGRRCGIVAADDI